MPTNSGLLSITGQPLGLSIVRSVHTSVTTAYNNRLRNKKLTAYVAPTAYVINKICLCNNKPNIERK